MNRIIFLPLVLLLLLPTFQKSYADVLIDSSNIGGIGGQITFNEALVSLFEGNSENFILFSAVTFADGPNSFNLPAPGTWTQYSEQSCAGGNCIHGIWGGYTGNGFIGNIVYSWTDPQYTAVGGYFRYTGVDSLNPVIEVACDTGTGSLATAPSVTTEPNSQVVRFYTTTRVGSANAVAGSQESDNPANQTNELPFDDTISMSVFSPAAGFGSQMIGESEFFLNGGDSGTQTVELEPDNLGWSACTVGLRMQTRNVPTLSEWGLIALASVMGIIGFMVIRRKNVTA